MLLLVAACQSQDAYPVSQAQAVAGVDINIRVTPVALDLSDFKRRTLGKLTLVSCVELSSGHPKFGGLSGLRISEDGSKLLAVSDQGWWLGAKLGYTPSGALAKVSHARLARLMAPDGRPLPPYKRLSDAEEVAVATDQGLLVSFERTHRLWLYPLPGWDLSQPPRQIALPPWLVSAPVNKGVEAMARLKDGRWLILTEGLEQDGYVLGAVGLPGAWQPIRYQLSGELRPTGAATLPSGDLVLTERSYSLAKGVAVRVVTIAAASIQPHAVLKPRVLAELREPLAVDNFEGIAVRAAPKGRTLIYMISDDNYSPIQRTLLQIWALDIPAK